MSTEISVVLVDDHDLVREGVKQLLQAEGNVVVVGEANSVETALAVTAKQQPDVIVLDLRLNGEDGQEVLRELRGRGDMTPVLVLSAHNRATDLERALAAGATGYLLKTTSAAALGRAVADTAAGKTVIDPAFVPELIGYKSTGPRGNVTGREQQVLELAAEGLSNREIGERLGVSGRTAQKHLEHLYAKFGVHDRTQLVTHAFRLGLLHA
ncbi:MAG TPA: response regulator transcription factor [Egibacteraceae bacterium]|nr:response regulator transcription factor [Egibacteraceae bacterium]